MCRCCDYNSGDCVIFQDMVGAWYLDHQTGEWDIYEDGFIHDRIYINYCPFCGERLGNNEIYMQ